MNNLHAQAIQNYVYQTNHLNCSIIPQKLIPLAIYLYCNKFRTDIYRFLLDSQLLII